MELKLAKVASRYPDQALLIVPYGIETVYTDGHNIAHNSFNCTLWN